MNDYMVEVVKVLHIDNALFINGSVRRSVVTYTAMVVDTNYVKRLWINGGVVVISQMHKAAILYEIEKAVFSDLTTNGFTVPKGLKCLFKDHIGKTEEDDDYGMH